MNPNLDQDQRYDRDRLDALHAPGGWTYHTWRRPIRWRLVTAAAGLTVIDVALASGAVAYELAPAWAAGIALGVLAATWSHYLRRPISGIDAHRSIPPLDQEPHMTTTRPTVRPQPSPALHQAALDYAERGWHVFPLRPGTKKPAVPNHPAHLCDHTDPRCADGHTGWEQRATTNPDRIERAWTRRRYGIGIACGPSGLIVVDLDTPKTVGHRSGLEHLAHLEHQHSDRLPATFTVATPRGGQHRYYRRPPGSALANTASRIAPHIDTRAAGGYVVAPPTRTTDGAYHCTDPCPPTELPAWFAQLVTATCPVCHGNGAWPPGNGWPCPRCDGGGSPKPPQRPPDPALPPPGAPTPTAPAAARYIDAALTGELDRLATAGPGTRNNTLFTVAVALGQLVGARALDHGVAHQRLLEAASGHLAAGAYSHTQALRTIASGLHRGAQQPRRLPTHLTTQDTRS